MIPSDAFEGAFKKVKRRLGAILTFCLLANQTFLAFKTVST